jgi:hypothetical protein
MAMVGRSRGRDLIILNGRNAAREERSIEKQYEQ